MWEAQWKDEASQENWPQVVHYVSLKGQSIHPLSTTTSPSALQEEMLPFSQMNILLYKCMTIQMSLIKYKALPLPLSLFCPFLKHPVLNLHLPLTFDLTTTAVTSTRLRTRHRYTENILGTSPENGNSRRHVKDTPPDLLLHPLTWIKTSSSQPFTIFIAADSFTWLAILDEPYHI